MAYTSADLDKLDRAIAGGVLEWQHAGRRIRYQSMDDMLKARAHVSAQITAAASTSQNAGATRRFKFQTGRGE
jgi:roadblock/LC7 domain-containing protein